MFAALINHLWQTTIFALAAGFFTLAFRKNRANVRYVLWLAASLKFLIPFALLIALGINLWSTLAVRNLPAENAALSIAQALVQTAQPIPERFSFTPVAHVTNWPLIAIFITWSSGLLAIVMMRFRAWLRIRAALRSSTPLDVASPKLSERHPEGRDAARRTSLAVAVRTTPGLLEPGVVGFFHPTLLLPEGLLDNLTPPQLEAILAHEFAHIRRRDNLTAALHMLVESIFWFHPLVWWIGAQLIEERERACDEAVLSLGNQPRDYAEAILNVCKLYVESPLACVSGVTGTTINTRVRAILARRLGGDMHTGKKLMLTAVCFAALAIPVAIGMIIARPIHAQSAGTSAVTPSQNQANPSSAQQAVPRVGTRSMSNATSNPDYLEALGTVTAASVVVRPQADGQLTSVNFKEGSLVKQGQVLASVDVPGNGLALQRAQVQLDKDRALLDATIKANGEDPGHQAAIEELKGTIRMDQAEVQRATDEASKSQVIAPITGVAGFLQVDTGNLIHAGEALVVINQVQPIAAVFNIQEDFIPRVQALQRDGSSPTVVLFERENKTRIATGHVTALDNHIDDTTGTVKLKAEFDNKNGALFPNEFVNVRMYWQTH